MTEATKRFGERLTMARMLRLGISQAAMAERLGIGLALLQAIERGEAEAPAMLDVSLMKLEAGEGLDASPLSAPHANLTEPASDRATVAARPIKHIAPPGPDPWADRRKLWKAHHAACEEARSAGCPLPSFPDDLRGLPCGARTRRGGRCRRTDLEPNGRCRFHGGLSTGARSAEGKARALATLKLRWKVERA